MIGNLAQVRIFLHTDSATGSSWSHDFVMLTERKKVTSSHYSIVNRQNIGNVAPHSGQRAVHCLAS